jgi:ribosomal protein L40E
VDILRVEEGNGSVGTNTVMMDENLGTVRQEIEAGSVSPHSLVLLFNAASDAEHAGDVATIEETLKLARAIAEMAGASLQAEARRLATICEQSLASVRERLEASGATEPRDRMTICPECGNEVPPDALRCRRCGHRFI